MQRIRDWASENGYLVRFARPEALGIAWDAVVSLRDSIDAALYETMLAPHHKRWLEADWEPTSVIVVACPSPPAIVRFHLDTGPMGVLVPPAYIGYRERYRTLEADLRTLLGPRCRVQPAAVPLKSLASRIGLVKYGRNNITYTEDFGSCQMLAGFVTDAHLEPIRGQGGEEAGEESLGFSAIRKPSVMDECEDCEKCVNACPTSAISSDRFLLHAHRCLTALNEDPGDWPQWLDPKAHNALVGCVKCQAICPKNQGRFTPQRIEEEFTVEETKAFLVGDVPDNQEAWQAITKKLEDIGLFGYSHAISRNLVALVSSRNTSA